MTVVQHFDDIGYTVICTPGDVVMHFKVYSIVGHDPRADERLYEGCINLQSEPPLFMHGAVKWDGCCNFAFDEQDRVMLHFCGKRSVESFSKLMTELFKLASQHVEKWDESVAL